jgi:hypothetical protein
VTRSPEPLRSELIFQIPASEIMRYSLGYSGNEAIYWSYLAMNASFSLSRNWGGKGVVPADCSGSIIHHVRISRKPLDPALSYEKPKPNHSRVPEIRCTHPMCYEIWCPRLIVGRRPTCSATRTGQRTQTEALFQNAKLG